MTIIFLNHKKWVYFSYAIGWKLIIATALLGGCKLFLGNEK